MNTEQTSKNIPMYIKTHYGETILAKIRELEKTMIKYSFYVRNCGFDKNELVTLHNFLSVSFIVSVQVCIFPLNMCDIIIYVAL